MHPAGTSSHNGYRKTRIGHLSWPRWSWMKDPSGGQWAKMLYIGLDTGDPRHADLWGPGTTVTGVWSRQGLWRTTTSVKLLSTSTALLLCSPTPYLRCFPNIPLQICIPKDQWHISDVICFPAISPGHWSLYQKPHPRMAIVVDSRVQHQAHSIKGLVSTTLSFWGSGL